MNEALPGDHNLLIVFIEQGDDRLNTYPRDRIKDYCRRRGIHFVDSSPYIAKAAEAGPVYWKIDQHCNEAGYRAIAEAGGTGEVRTGISPHPW